ncbi:YadA-like family protein [Snodgrassella sp. B3088]|uniref:YadA-like family protein n=1 Tax=Snodgrassella sp. B3088 TaxID=2818038 RepID=UPI002269BB0A|nr:YadA-like family protein [Snodgrassella sp. B3088]MCX8748652.1 YadA-like family protein [Snodgrassella sp. B3088]
MHKVNKVLICSAVSILFANTAYAADKESVCNATGVNGIKTESIFPTIGNPHCEVSLTEDVLDKINNSANNANNAISAAGNAQTVANNANTTANNALNTANEAKDLANKSKNTNSAGNNIKVNSSNNSDGSTNYEITTADDVNFNSVGSNSIQTGSVIIDREKTDADGHTIIQGVGQGSVNAGSNEVVNGGQLWQVQQEAKNDAEKAKTTVSAGNNIKVNSSKNANGSTNYEITTADDVNFNSVGSNSIQTGSVIIDREKTDADGHTIIQGVGQGSVNAGSNEVVNGGQLWQVQQEAKNEINKIKSGQSGLILTDGKTTTIDKAGTSSVIDITGANGDRILTGVANGVNPNDAVNVSQLQDYQQQNSNRLNTLNNKIDHNRKVSSQGIASVAAMSIEYPQQEPGHVATGIGFGTYDGENAIGWGINYLAPTGKTKIYGGVAQAFGSGTHAVGKVGISFVF